MNVWCAVMVAALAAPSLEQHLANLRDLLARDMARDSLLAFIEYTCPGWETGEHHRVMCHWLERLERAEIQNLAVFAPPRHSKSTIVSQYFPAWCAGRNPRWEMLCVSKTDELVETNGGKVRDIVASRGFQNVFPGVVLKEDSKAKGKWSVQHGAQVGAYYGAGVGGTIIGHGANLLDLDDLQDAESAASETQRKAVKRFYFSDCVTRLMYPSLQLLTMTRRHEDDIGGTILGTEDTWEATDDPRVFTKSVVLADGADPVTWHILRLRAIEDEGTPDERALWPGVDNKRFPLGVLRSKKAQQVSAGLAAEWNAQYQQDPTPEDGDYCKTAWFVERWERSGEERAAFLAGLRVYMTADPAVTEKETGNDPDFTEIGVFGLDGIRFEEERGDDGTTIKVVSVDKLYELDWWYGQKKADVWVDQALAMARQWKPRAFFLAKGQIKNAVEPMLVRALRESRTSLRLEWLTDHKDKAAKGLPFQRMAASGRVVFRANHPDSQRVIDQCVKFPNARKKDAFDTVANMCRALAECSAAFVGAETAADEPARRYERHRPMPRDWRVM